MQTWEHKQSHKAPLQQYSFPTGAATGTQKTLSTTFMDDMLKLR